MPNTRHADSDSPLAFERYLSSPIYADRRPIPANIVAEKALGYRSPADRRLLFFLQALSVEDGGLMAAASDLSCFQNVGTNLAAIINPQELHKIQMAAYLAGEGETASRVVARMAYQFLISLCIDPTLDLDELRRRPEGRDMLLMIEEFRLQRLALEKAAIVVTTLGAEAWEILDQAASLGGINIVEASAGAGKTEAGKGWYRAHLGEAYFITLSGITTRTNLMQAIAAALGLATCQRKASELQAKIETFFRRTGAFLIIDEAHFLWPQSKRISSNPELIDWIDTLVNMGARIALICTDQFARQKDHVEKQTAWTADQFRRRVREHRVLDGSATLADLELVARHLLSFARDEATEEWTVRTPKAPQADAIQLIVHGSNKSELPLSTAGNLVSKARYLAVRDDRDRVTLRDILAALEGQERSEVALNTVRRPRRRPDQTPPVTPPTTISAPARTEQMSRLSAVLPAASSRRRTRPEGLAKA